MSDTQPEMEDINLTDAVERLQDFINECDYDTLAQLYSLHCADKGTAVRVFEVGHPASDAGNYYLAGKCMRVQLVPVEEQKGGE